MMGGETRACGSGYPRRARLPEHDGSASSLSVVNSRVPTAGKRGSRGLLLQCFSAGGRKTASPEDPAGLASLVGTPPLESWFSLGV